MSKSIGGKLDEPIDWHFPRGDLAGHYLDQFTIVGGHAQVLFAARGKGKTQFMLRDLVPQARARGLLPVYVNFWEDNQHPAQAVVMGLLQAGAQEAATSSRLKQLFRGIQAEMTLSGGLGLPGVGDAKLQISGGKRKQAQAISDARTLLAGSELFQMHQVTDAVLEDCGQRIIFVFDEVQTLALKREHEPFVRSLRTLLDSRRGRVVSVFTGSSQSKLTEMFQRIKAPLYNFATNDLLPALGDPFLEHWRRSISRVRGGVPAPSLERMRAAFARTDQNPRVFWDAVLNMIKSGTMNLERCTADAVAAVQSNAGVVQRLRDLTPLDRLVLGEIVRWGLVRQRTESAQVPPLQLFSAGVRQRMALTLGMTPTPAQVQSAVRRLQAPDVQLVICRERGVYEVEDQFFLESLAEALDGEVDGLLLSDASEQIARADSAEQEEPARRMVDRP